MTLHEVTNQLYYLSVGGFFNRQKVTKRWLHDYLDTLLVRSNRNKRTPKTIVMEIALPDGWFFFSINSFIDGNRMGFDYYIPDSKEKSKQLFDSLLH